MNQKYEIISTELCVKLKRVSKSTFCSTWINIFSVAFERTTPGFLCLTHFLLLFVCLFVSPHLTCTQIFQLNVC